MRLIKLEPLLLCPMTLAGLPPIQPVTHILVLAHPPPLPNSGPILPLPTLEYDAAHRHSPITLTEPGSNYSMVLIIDSGATWRQASL